MELIAVVVILAVLAAIALPRFVDFSTEAHDASLTAIGAGYKAGADQVHSYWPAKDSPGAHLNLIL